MWNSTVEFLGNIRSGCSIAVFTIESIHHGWDTIPVEGFKYSSSSSATDNMVRYGVQPRFLEVYTDRASHYRNEVLMVWHRSSSLTKDFSELFLTATSEVRKGKSSGNLPTRNSTATIGVIWVHGLYESTEPPIHR
ncbi:hypothetical protein LOTGIDRAFT_173933 [Lottia gigantea]|uniref:Uncharacterized protein n=1 Tax=Lottia gigantea TaxID=225164 RepID=V4AVK9_LOTGI|nr:hypothetical protein LOTGIDRAFT_173933 [Lottia gigantea]ESO99095.1 hypothetical protein LOTGIDRAFT_173933 [Lottia gigantea]